MNGTTNGTTFAVAQVKALCNGRLPYGDGFAWERVEYFKLEDGVLQPYSDNTILPGPGIRIAVNVEPKHDHSRIIYGHAHRADRYPDGCLVLSE